MKRWLAWILVGNGAYATECGEARLAQAHFKAAAQVEQDQRHSGPAHDARAGLEKADSKVRSACTPHKVKVTALPLGYVALPPGNGSKATFEPGSEWGLHLSTAAGAQNGIVFNDA